MTDFNETTSRLSSRLALELELSKPLTLEQFEEGVMNKTLRRAGAWIEPQAAWFSTDCERDNSMPLLALEWWLKYCSELDNKVYSSITRVRPTIEVTREDHLLVGVMHITFHPLRPSYERHPRSGQVLVEASYGSDRMFMATREKAWVTMPGTKEPYRLWYRSVDKGGEVYYDLVHQHKHVQVAGPKTAPAELAQLPSRLGGVIHHAFVAAGPEVCAALNIHAAIVDPMDGTSGEAYFALAKKYEHSKQDFDAAVRFINGVTTPPELVQLYRDVGAKMSDLVQYLKHTRVLPNNEVSNIHNIEVWMDGLIHDTLKTLKTYAAENPQHVR